MPTSLDLTQTLRETQLQHGLRAEDYGRYHRYLSNRLATLRKQLNLSNDKKKFLNKPVPTAAADVQDERFALILALYAERCWAESEHQLASRASAGEDKSGLPPLTQSRKRLNKAVGWVEKLVTFANNNGDDRLKQEAQAYLDEMKGRCFVSHMQFEEGKKHFTAARNAYFGLKKSSTTTQWEMVLSKVAELDDRVVYCMQCLGDDVSKYKPEVDESQKNNNANVQWLNRSVPVYSVKVKDALRDISGIDALALRDAALASASTAASGKAVSLIPLGTQTRVLDAFDRIIGRFNDALIATRQELRDVADARKRDTLLLVHYLQYQVSLYTYHRTMFMVNVFERRFKLTTKDINRKSGANNATTSNANVLVSSKKGGKTSAGRQNKEIIPSSLYASPAELVRLFELAIQALEEMSMLPGVEDHYGDDVEKWTAEARAGKLVYLGEGWRIAEDTGMAVSAFDAAKKEDENKYTTAATRCHVAMTAEATLAKEAPGAAASSSTKGKFVADNADEFVPCTGFVKFPPDYQAVPCKPVFVDIASTYLDFPVLRTASGAKKPAASAPAPKKEKKEAAQAAAPEEEGADGEKKGWFGGWGWGGKK